MYRNSEVFHEKMLSLERGINSTQAFSEAEQAIFNKDNEWLYFKIAIKFLLRDVKTYFETF